ncbi:Meiosis regulator and mRNA stability factor 1, partial [Cucurbita argyrosperma subsp. sororia]
MRLFSSSTFSLSSLCSSSPPRALLLHFSQFSASFSSSNYSFPSSSSSRRHDEESRYVRVSVWWDFENCNIPAGVNVFKVAHLITAAVRANGIKGPVQITAFGDILQLSRTNQEALSSTGISLTHIPQGGKNSADRSLLVDLMCWVSQNPPPAHLFLISGDRDFASILHRLRMNNYNVLLASPESAPGVLCSAASIMWHWNALVKGENLVGRHFNQPPDGPYGSWYGHYKVPLEDPFPVNEQASSIRSEEVSEISSDPKPLPIPRAVIREIRYILKLYPKGISITDLRSELGKSKISIDRDYYGYKKFSRFLLSMPHTLKLQTNGDGQLIVRIVTPRTIEPFESSRGTSDNGTEEQDRNLIAKLNNNGSSPESTSVPLVRSSELNAQDRPEKVQPSYELVKSTGEAMGGEPSTWPVSEPHVMEDSKQTSKFEADNNMIPSIGQHSEAKTGFFRRIWRRFVVGSKDHNSENGSHHISEKCSTSDDASKQKSCGHVTNYSNQNLGEAKSEGKTVKPMSEDANSVHPVSNSPDREPAKLQKTAVVASAYDDKSRSRPGVLSSIRNWFKIRENDTETGKESEQCCEQNQLKNECGKHQLFSRSSFWQDMQSFIETPKGVELILQSKTRSEMAQKLLEEGPLVLKSLSTSELFDFIESLISDKKWLVECPSETNPFKVTLSTAEKSSCTKPLHRANGLTSIFMNRVSQPSLQGSSEHDSDSDKKNENVPQAGISTTMTKSKFPERTRSEILCDCQNLVDEILREHPEGYNMGAFRKLFLEKYGYHLDLQKLGYPKLASLLQIMPGVTIESTFIVPTGKVPKVSHVVANSDNESSDLPRKDDDFESTWEELGPAFTDCRSRNEDESTSSSETAEATEKRPKVCYEPVVLEDESSTESDGESCPTTQRSEEQAKPQTNKEESPLLQILDSWYGNKEHNSRKNNSENSDEMNDCFENSLKVSSLTAKNEANTGSFARKQRHQKSYSFVLDTDENDKEKLIDGILGTLKKSSESRVHD